MYISDWRKIAKLLGPPYKPQGEEEEFCNDEFNEYHLWKLDKMTFLPIFYIDFRGQPFLRNLELKSDILTLKR